jgi:hypothetical protein
VKVSHAEFLKNLPNSFGTDTRLQTDRQYLHLRLPIFKLAKECPIKGILHFIQVLLRDRVPTHLGGKVVPVLN